MTNSALPVLINREGGAAAAAGFGLSQSVTTAFAKAGAQVDVQMLAASEMNEAIKRAASSHRRIVVAGGDGTIASAAQLLTNTKVELAVLPLGTLNHFARDLQIPTILDAAAELAVNGMASPVDVGEVNGRRFINNASVGLYPSMVKDRDRIRHEHHVPKWLASIPACWAALARLPHHRMRIDTGHGEAPIVSPLLLVGNNRYSLQSGSMGSRDSLDAGLLSIYVVSRTTRLGLLWFGVRAALGRVSQTQDFELVGDCEAMTVRLSHPKIEIALDGEVQRLSLPLKFCVRPGALKIVRPSF